MMPASLQQRFAINNALRFEDRPGGLTCAIISTESAEAEVYLHGAHVTQWTPRWLRIAAYRHAARRGHD
jgi:hypothetical protein